MNLLHRSTWNRAGTPSMRAFGLVVCLLSALQADRAHTESTALAGGSDAASTPAPVSSGQEEPYRSRALSPALLAAIVKNRPVRPVVDVLTDELVRPWGMALLPDGRLLVTEKAGTLTLLGTDGARLVDAVQGVPPVASGGQGGLLDIAVDPDFAGDPWVYWTFSEPGTGAEAGLTGTAVARGRLDGGSLSDVSVIHRQSPKLSSSGHYGSRLAFGPDGRLFVTLGDRRSRNSAQDLSTGLGKVLRLNTDGTVPDDNPVWPDGRSAVFSFGHRNPQGAAIHPDTGELWVSEHGPRGGDEINRVVAGANYGWPVVSYGCEYGEPVGADCEIGGGTHAPDYREPISTWVPTSTAPAGITFYRGSLFPEWRDNLLVSALAGRTLWRITLRQGRETGREALLQDSGERIRDVGPSPAGGIYVLTDSGKLLVLSRASQ